MFFGLGGYAMAHAPQARRRRPGQAARLHGAGAALDELPLLLGAVRATRVFALPMAVLLPMARRRRCSARWSSASRVRGAYFAILTQALAAAFVILLVGQQGTTGGTNGLTNFQSFFGYDLDDPVNQRMLYFIVAGALLGAVYLVARQLMHSRYGRAARRRARRRGPGPLPRLRPGQRQDRRLRASSAGMAGLAGALFVPVVGIISPALLGIVPSIEIVIGVAVGGRARWSARSLGAVAGQLGQDQPVSEQLPGRLDSTCRALLFIVVVAFAPGGLAGGSGAASCRRRGVAAPPARTGDRPDHATADGPADGRVHGATVAA